METTETRWQRHVENGRRYVSQGDYAQAEQSLLAAVKEALTLGPADLRVASSLGILGKLKHRQGERERAQGFLERALAVREEALGHDHYGVVQGLNDLASLHYAYGQLDEARTLFERALAIAEKQLAPDHGDLALALYNLSRVYFKSGDYLRAEPLLARLLDLKERTLGEEHTDVAAILTALSRVRSMAGRHEDAEAMARRALAIRESGLPAADPAIAISLELVAYFCAGRAKRMRSLADAERILGGGRNASHDDTPASPVGDTTLDSELEALAAEERTLRERARDIRSRSGERREPNTLERSPEPVVVEAARDSASTHAVERGDAAADASERSVSQDAASARTFEAHTEDVAVVRAADTHTDGASTGVTANAHPEDAAAAVTRGAHTDDASATRAPDAHTESTPQDVTIRDEQQAPVVIAEHEHPAPITDFAPLPRDDSSLRGFTWGRQGRRVIGIAALGLIGAGGAGFAMGRGARAPVATPVITLQESSRGMIDQPQAGSLQAADRGGEAGLSAAPPPAARRAAPVHTRRPRSATPVARVPSKLQASRMTRTMERVGQKVMTGVDVKVDSIGRSLELPPPKFGQP